MEFFTDLESLISSQDITNESAADVLAEIGSPSVSIAILDHGSIISKCISTVGGDSETLFQACSISKPIAGMAAMRLIQAGKLQLDSKIVQLLPDSVISILETPHTKVLLQQITVRHLMSHTSGINIAHFSGYSKDAPDTKTVLSGRAPANTPQVKLQGLPGYALSYSGGGMMVLQIILEAVTGKDFPTLVKELVLDPLGMSRSFYALQDGDKNVATAYFTGYTPCDVQWHVLPEKAAAGLWTTPTDLLKAVRALQQSLKGDAGKEFLEEEIAREMLEEVQNSMALTWIAPKDPGIAFVHSGTNDPGWGCFVMGYADLKNGSGGQNPSEQRAWDHCGICVMTNSAAGFTAWAKVFHAITYLKGWVSLPNLVGGGPFGKIPFCARGVKINERWGEWKGSWRDAEMELVLESNEDAPVLRFGKNVSAKLVPAAIPCLEYAGNEKSIDLVLEGLEMMVRLGWKDGNRDIEMWYDGLPPRLVHLSRVD
ncbi:beta-lactamase/transpeptidase-like protein [Stipitochalara longipes BDJ]|nr:beta-lactamase/transpeptidase-like protein [Stipitochalara longipes BDJ]